ncbi:hypothetical protein [Amycolatopsis cihanbeyliensis]|uniref:hypothetical protein n=1 Tax=Amycolatopsis cihanbeyliensis TaxID=1128664 RepID=UPI00114D5F54|nr:hypothetical protein [Amycolatopsis cihanbeyliensis]
MEQPRFPEHIAERILGKVDTVPMDLWIGANHLPLKVVVDTSAAAEASGAPPPQTVRYTMTYSDWGKAVNVTAPPANEIRGN